MAVAGLFEDGLRSAGYYWSLAMIGGPLKTESDFGNIQIYKFIVKLYNYKVMLIGSIATLSLSEICIGLLAANIQEMIDLCLFHTRRM